MAFFLFKKFLFTDENDNCLVLTFCLNWITHFFHLIPKQFILKGILYYISCIILLVIDRPNNLIGTIVVIANIIGHSIRQYIILTKYHENCVILNKIETEKSINKYNT